MVAKLQAGEPRLSCSASQALKFTNYFWAWHGSVLGKEIKMCCEGHFSLGVCLVGRVDKWEDKKWGGDSKVGG